MHGLNFCTAGMHGLSKGQRSDQSLRGVLIPHTYITGKDRLYTRIAFGVRNMGGLYGRNNSDWVVMIKW